MSTSQATTSVLLPDLGESVSEGVVVEWRKAVGDRVEAGETLVDVTTDKVDVEVPSPVAGTLARIVAQAGETVAVGALLAEIGAGEAGETPAPAAAPPAPPRTEAPPAPHAEAPDALAEAPAQPAAASASADAGAGEDATVAIVLPPMESVTEGVVVEWRKAVGETVEKDEIVVEVSTDKVDLEVPSPAAGRLARIAVEAGDSFQVSQALGEIAVGEGAEIPAAQAPAPALPAADGQADARDVPSEPDRAGPAVDAPLPEASPLARRLAAEAGIDLRSVSGTGPGGIVRRNDVRVAISGNGRSAPAPASTPALAGPASTPAPGAPRTAPAHVPAGEGEVAVALKGPAAALAGYMDQSLSVPTATSFRTIAVSTLDARRRELNAALKEAGRAEKLSYTHLIAWAIARAAQRWPVMGTAYGVVDGKPHRFERPFVNLGLAVDVERKDGSRSLMVPVVKGAESLGFAGFLAAMEDLVQRTRGGGITVDELRGATLSLTNPGGLGTVASLPRLMPGQGTIVATGAIGYPPGLASVEPTQLEWMGAQKVVTLSSTYDHRVIQGAESGAFLREIDQFLAGDNDFYDDVATSLGLGLDGAGPIAEPTSAPAPATPASSADANDEVVRAVAAAMSLVKAHRTHGHLLADLDPLGSTPPGDPALEPETVGLTPEVMERVPAVLMRVAVPGDTFADVLPRLRETYCGTMAYEIEHISNHEQRMWLRGEIESGAIRKPLERERRAELLQRLIEVETFERFLRRSYLGHKTFSIEGLDALVPVLDEIILLSAEGGAAEIVLGMAHRGRLSVMTHIVGRSPESILSEFQGHVALESEDTDVDVPETAGDVKYHLGSEGTYVTPTGRVLTVSMAANPSHLEQVNAVVEGRTRARQTIRKGHKIRRDPTVAVPLLVHGDAAFPGQGVVAETLNLNGLAGYSTGGTIHIIANNQIGFTTDCPDSRSTRYASDLAKGFDIPIVHVNADDVDACISAAQLAVGYRKRFGRDVLIDLIGYRRLGHNEVDEPAYTQPVMARTIKDHQPVAEIYARKLVDEGDVLEADVAAWRSAAEARMVGAQAAVTGHGDGAEEFETRASSSHRSRGRSGSTGLSAESLISLNEQLLRVPEGFQVHSKLAPQLERRRAAMGEEGGILWAHAELLAIASLIVEGVPVRLTGQDAARGTFSQRHMELHHTAEDQHWVPGPGRAWTPMAHLNRASATFELHNSPLSEAATVGFEYGYSTEAPDALVLWEAQYGDFANGAQIMIDQFIVSGRAKWGQPSRLTLLLPHGYEGNGPEHSSARPERFLQLAAEGNIRVANLSSADQYFHLLRKQARSDELRPLVVLTPKSLLRLRGASCRLDDLVHGSFRPVLDDPRAADRRESVRRLLICSGKVFHDLDAHAARAEAGDLAVARVEMLYPFPEEALGDLLEGYPSIEDVSWVQEEPRNMGAWDFIARRIQKLLPEGIELGYVGRTPRASPSEGYPQSHAAEQERLLQAALEGVKVETR